MKSIIMNKTKAFSPIIKNSIVKNRKETHKTIANALVTSPITVIDVYLIIWLFRLYNL